MDEMLSKLPTKASYLVGGATIVAAAAALAVLAPKLQQLFGVIPK